MELNVETVNVQNKKSNDIKILIKTLWINIQITLQ